jgi:hypothetical protein
MGRYLELAKKACAAPAVINDLPDDWRMWFEERAAIMEYDGGLSRERAEAEALAETIRLMRAR